MGYNTTVVIFNDALNSIENDPDFGKRLVSAIIRGGVGNHEPIEVSAGGFCNAACVIETHHSSHEVLVKVGRNYGTVTNVREKTLRVEELEARVAELEAVLTKRDQDYAALQVRYMTMPSVCTDAHEWQHRCGRCGVSSELDGCTETERSSAIAALGKIMGLVPDPSEIHDIAAAEHASLCYEQRRAAEARPSEARLARDDVFWRTGWYGHISKIAEAARTARKGWFEWNDRLYRVWDTSVGIRWEDRGFISEQVEPRTNEAVLGDAEATTGLGQHFPPRTNDARADSSVAGALSEATCPDGTDPHAPSDRGFVCAHEARADKLEAALREVISELVPRCRECDQPGEWVEATFSRHEIHWCDEHVSIPQKAISKGANRSQPQRMRTPHWLEIARAALRVSEAGR